MKKSIKKLLIVSTLAIITFQSSFFTVDQRQQVLILQFGEPIRVINTPGIKFKMPFIQNAIYFEKRIIDLSLPEQEVIASDQKRLIINAFTKFQIVDPLKFYTTVGGSNGLSNKLSGILDSSLRQVIGEVTLNELLTENRGNIMRKIKDAVGSSSEIFGIKIIDVRIMRADLPKENSDAIYARMQTEREKEAREIRAKGAEEADKIRAEANKQKTIILAEAKKTADITRGNGEKESNKIYASSFGKDPDFADFYRSMIAYKIALSNDKTKMIISPDSNFFKYFSNSKK
ncbi:MAG: protease modulator HflC [Proteobacteria bacterium]|nr:protease modulator HflC [Pseudomonadota bacterium]NCA27679.1 protease modulator HflC [Pseudomonadota bacterium]